MAIKIVLSPAVLRNEKKSIVNLLVVGGYTARCVCSLAVADSQQHHVPLLCEQCFGVSTFRMGLSP